MSEPLKLFIAGVVGIGLVTAFGLHAKGLAKLTESAGKAGGGLIGQAEGGGQK